MKAVVLEVRGREAAVLVENGTVRRMRGSYRVGEKLIVAEETAQSRVRRWIAVAASVIALVGISGGYLVDQNLVGAAEVSLDVNPSIVYTVNRRDRVLSVQAANEDAEEIVETLKDSGVRFTPIADAVQETLELLEDEGYLSAEREDYVLMNVSSDDERAQETLTEQVEAALESSKDASLEYRIDHSDRATAKKAAESGMSAGRYTAWKQAVEETEDGEDTPELTDFSRRSVRDILHGKDRRENEVSPVETPSAQPEAPVPELLPKANSEDDLRGAAIEDSGARQREDQPQEQMPEDIPDMPDQEANVPDIPEDGQREAPAAEGNPEPSRPNDEPPADTGRQGGSAPEGGPKAQGGGPGR